MPVRLYNDPDEEKAAVARSRQSWDRIYAARRQVTAVDAQAASTMAANYPHMSPGTVVPLAQAGVAPDDPLAQHVALKEAKSNKKKRNIMSAFGDLVGGITHIPANVMQFGVGDVLNPIGGAALAMGKPVLRRTLAGAMFLPELGAAGVRTAADIGGNVGAGLASGAAVGGAIGLPFGGIGALPGAAVGAIAGGVAGVGAGLLAEAKGVDIESDGGLVNPLSQTTVGQMAAGKSLGSGYMPGGEAVAAQAAAARKSAAIGGHAVTPGRFLASTVVEEGTAPYNLLSGAMDAAVAWRLDPTSLALKKVGAVRQAGRTLAATEQEVSAATKALSAADRIDAGLVEGSRKTIITEKVDRWLGTAKGQESMQWFAEKSFEDIRKLFGPKVDIGTVRELADATTLDEVNAILRPKLGLEKGLEMKPQVGGLGMTVKQTLKKLPGGESRLWNDLPGEGLDYSDATSATDNFNLLIKDANVLGDDAAKATEEFANHMLDGSYSARRAADALVYRTVLRGIGNKVDRSGKAVEFLDSVARRAADGDAQMLQSLINEDVTKTMVRAVSLDGSTHGLPASGFLTGYIDSGIDLNRGVVRDIRAATSRYSGLFTNPKVKLGGAALQHFTDDVWKPTALLRGAWTVRVVGEEQIRMAAAGRLSVFNHPLSYLSWAMDDESRIAKILGKARIKSGRGAVDAGGERFAKEGTTIVAEADELDRLLLDGADEYTAGLGIQAQTDGWHGDGTQIGPAQRKNYVKGEAEHVPAVAENIDQAFSDPLVRMLASEPVPVVRKWFVEGEGNQYRQALINKHNAPLRSNAEIDAHIEKARKQLNAILGRSEEVGAVPAGRLTGTNPMSAEEVSQLHASRQAARPGSPQVREAIATGELNGVALRDTKGRVNKDFIAELKKVEDLPDQIIGTAARTNDKLYQAKRDAAVQKMFSFMMSRPSARLSRSPMFRQSYWAEAKNVITELDSAAQAKMIESAVTAKLPKADIEALRARAKVSSGNLKIHEADYLLKGRALDQTQELLYDAAKRGQISDVMRIVMPFAEAQKEVMKTWARIGTKTNPATVRRAQQVLQGARGSGAFYKDPTTGEEMFTFPASQWLTEHTLGLPIPMTGRVAGLNTFGSGVIPGMGPAIQIPTRLLLPDKPQFDDLHKFLDPFGASSEETEGILEQQFPSWLTNVKRAFSANDTDRTFANAVKDIWASGVSSGRYRTDTPEALEEGLGDAKRNARLVYMIKGLSALGGAPTPPSPAFMAMDKDGKWHMAKALSADYRKMADDPEIGFDGATPAFLEKYGNNAFAFMQAKTFSTVPSAPTTGDFRQWTGTKEGAAAKKYGDVAALFGPQGEGFDYNTYLRNIKSGDTVSMTPQQFQEQTNSRMATMIYFNYKDRFGPAPSKEQRAWLSDLKDKLREQFPGYGVELPGKPDAETVKNIYIPKVIKAVDDPALADNDVARATKMYLSARAAALASVKSAGYENFETNKASAPTRAWLRQILDQLTERVPDFAPMAERIFSREMKDDDVAEAAPEATA